MDQAFLSISNQIQDQIKKSQNILLHLHPSPDGDSIGGALAMMHVLRSMDKKVTVISGDSKLPEAFAALPGYDQIIHKNIFELDLKKFDLFLIQDSASLTQISSLSPLEFPDSLTTIVIDHHQTNPSFGNINLVLARYPANCQLLFDLFEAWKLKLDHDIAICLLFGIFTDTGGFKYSLVSKDTFLASSTLAEYAPDFSKYISAFENSATKGRLFFEALAIDQVKEYFNGSVAISVVSLEDLRRKKIDPEDTRKSDVPNKLRTVSTWKITVLATERKKGSFEASLRSQNGEEFDVSKIASILGGGGHKAASGASISGNAIEVVTKLTNAMTETYPKLAS